MHHGETHSPVHLVIDTTGFVHGTFSFIYLGYPIFYTRRRNNYYNDMIIKVKNRLPNWKGKMLSYEGKDTLISNVLHSILNHLLPLVNPPKCTIQHLHKKFAKFFWSNKDEGRSRHWASWHNLWLPTWKRGLGFRSLFDVLKVLFAKIWWIFQL